MKHMTFTAFLMAMLLLAIPGRANNRHEWQMATLNTQTGALKTTLYFTRSVEAENGNIYQRIYDMMGSEQDRACSLTRYGFAHRGKRVYMYDFETKQESVCMDYSLQVGDCFTAHNGERWEAVATRDTLVEDFELDTKVHSAQHRLLVMRNVDDGRMDTWLEGFGSFSNHLLLEKVADGIRSYLLWVYTDAMADGSSTDENYYIVNEFSDDPLFGHDTGWLNADYTVTEETPSEVTYEDGRLTITDAQYRWPSRYYWLFLRNGDDVHQQSGTELQPYIDGGDREGYTDRICLTGLPLPTSGKYTVHLNYKDISTGIEAPCSDGQAQETIHNVKGHRLKAAPEHGIYIKNGRKWVNR